MSDNDFDLSHRKLSQAEVSLLSKGLKFYLTPKKILNKHFVKTPMMT